MIEDAEIAPKGWPYVEMRRRGREPKSGMLCVLEMACRDERLGFEYSSISRFDLGDMPTAEAIKLARSGRIKTDERPIECEGYRRSRLSLNNDELDLIGFALGDSMANLEFTRDRPFSRVRGTRGIFSDPMWLDARMACFTADNREPGVHWFNIHLELIDGEGFGPIPLIIDPDVGYPGGTGGKRPPS